MKIKISVLVVTFNGCKYIEDQLNSILNQSYSISELIVIDDNSEDNTVEILNKILSELNLSYRIIINSVNIGARSNFEKGLYLATGDIVLLSDQDDIWHENKCSEVVDYFSKNTNISAVFTDGNLLINDCISNRSLWDKIFSKNIRETLNEYNLFDFIIYGENVATGATMAFRRKDLANAFPFIFHNNIWHDYWLALFFASQNKLGFLDKRLITYRIHKGQQVGILDLGLESAVHLRHRSWLCEFNSNDFIELINFYKYLHKFTFEFYLKTKGVNNLVSARLLDVNKNIHARLIYVKYSSNNRVIKFLKMIKHALVTHDSPKISISDIFKHVILNWRPVQL